MTRHLTRIGTLLVVVAALLVVPTVAQVPSGVAQAADARQFDAGNIISDAIFFDGWAMDASSVQRFLDSKGATCVAGEMPCLRNFRQDTATQAADALCNGYQGVRQESAATIIAKVGASCGINPRVLLVLLQKEQSLVTRTKPTTYAYTHATGFACPDTAPCDPAFSGFVSQVYFAARQFERYRVEASRYGYKAGRVNSILWHPNTSCGRSDVFIANQATAGLYNYTPYRPNQSALNAQYGTGDGCSSYGNRNFWLYFTDWFGSTQYPGASNVSAAYEARGGATGPLGSPTSTVVCGLVRSGCYQHYTGGSIFWSPATGAAVVKNAMRDTWAALDWERGALGYPRGDEHCGLAAGGCLQDFEGGAVAWSPATGARAVSGAIAQGWGWTGRESGPLGYPVEEMSCPAGGCLQTFQGGILAWTAAKGVHAVSGAIGELWTRLGRQTSPLGHPTSDMACTSTGCTQDFQGGTVTWTASLGARWLNGAIHQGWIWTGRETGTLGYPTGDMGCTGTGCTQDFQRGVLAWTPAGGVHAVTGPILEAWTSRDRQNGDLGHPTGDVRCQLRDGGCRQDFQRGTLAWSPATGARAVSGAIAQGWGWTGRESGPLGYPVEEMSCPAGGCLQTFQGGILAWTAAKGVHAVSGAIGELWTRLGRQTSPLGHPTSDMACTSTGCTQDFQGGTVTWTASLGARWLNGAIHQGWIWTGRETGTLGYPTGDMGCTGTGCTQDFQRGVLAWTPAGGVHAVTGPILEAWTSRDRQNGDLGHPTGDVRSTDSRDVQEFEGGTVTVNRTTGSVTVTPR